MLKSWAGLAAVAFTVLGCSRDPVRVDPPEPPEAAYQAEEVSFSSGELTLQGTLYVPKASARVPALVVVNGSGPVNRDGVYLAQPGLLPPIYRWWAELFAEEGMAVLRYDKRFITYPDLDPLALSQEDQVGDIVAAVRYLESRADVDPQRIFLLGHSEGASIAPVAAARAPVRAVVGIAALGFPVDSLVLEQLRGHPEVPDFVFQEVEEGFRLLREGRFPPGGNILGAGEAYWREWIHYSERADSIALTWGKPVLVVQGLDDENLPGHTLTRNVQTWERTASRSSLVRFRTYPGVTHEALETGTRKVAGQVMDEIVQWLRGS